jgi:DNA-binding response OmpR family regulator
MPAMNPTHLLLLEDEPVSLAFLREALATQGRPVDAALTCRQAEALASPRHGLWILDANLPDGHAIALLQRLRERGLHAPALALTADADQRTHAALRDAGFARVLCKPIGGEALRAAVAATWREAWTGDGLWDDAAALPALAGRDEALAALRGLFLRDLPVQLEAVRAALARGDHAAAREELHRLKAGCGFVGAPKLLEAVAELHARPDDPPALEAFLQHGRRHLVEA